VFKSIGAHIQAILRQVAKLELCFLYWFVPLAIYAALPYILQQDIRHMFAEMGSHVLIYQKSSKTNGSRLAGMLEFNKLLQRQSVCCCCCRYIGTEDMEKAFNSNDPAFVCPDPSSEVCMECLRIGVTAMSALSCLLSNVHLHAFQYVTCEVSQRSPAASECCLWVLQYMQIFKILHSKKTAPLGSLKTVLGQVH